MTNFCPKLSVRVHTLGCKVNFCDSNAMCQALLDAGFRLAASAPADVEILNTCAVTARSVAKARTLIRRIRSENPRAFLLVTGCAARLPGEVLSSIGEANAVCPTSEDAVDQVLGHFGGGGHTALSGGFDLGRTRAFVKIQDGCESFCTYCVVPHVRGNLRSLDGKAVVSLVEKALCEGFREVVLCGVHLGHYGRDLAGTTFADILRLVAAVPGDFRIRLSSIEPLEITREILDMMASARVFCPHLHLPLQSGSDRVLRAMNRPYTAESFLETVATARATLNNPAITTDIMVGFPGETDEDFAATLDVARKAAFARAHVFIFSPREGTPAATMRPLVPHEEGARRSRLVREASARTAADYRATLVGTTAEVVVEAVSNGFAEGFCARYQRIRFPAGGELTGSLASVYIEGLSPMDSSMIAALTGAEKPEVCNE